MKKTIKKYTQLNGISGNTEIIKKQILEVFSALKTEKNQIIEDNLGGIGFKILTPGATKTIAFLAHQDEVGLMVNRVDENGIVKIVNIGGITVESLIGQRVEYQVKDDKYTGIVLAPSPHVKKEKITKITELSVDFGFNNSEDAYQLGIEKGTYLNFIGEFKMLQNENFTAKACDNRIGIAVIERLVKKYYNQKLKVNLVIGATVQEEVGLRGVDPLLHASAENFDEVYVLDVSPVDGMEHFKLGKGPLLRVTEPRAVFSRELYQKMLKIAKQNSIPVQSYFARGGTDTARVQVHGDGIQATAICIPGLNLHTSSTICNLSDIEKMEQLIEKIIED